MSFGHSFSGGSDGKASVNNAGDLGSINPWVRKIPWRRKWQFTPVLLPGKSHGQRSLVGYSPWGRKELDTTERLGFHFLPRCMCLLISWLQSPSAVILEPKKIKSLTVSIISPSICQEVMEPDVMIFIF